MAAHHRLLSNDWNESYTLVTDRDSELHELSSCHHKTNTEGGHILVGDILKVKGSEVALIRSGIRLQNMLDCTVPPEQKEETVLLISCLNLG